MRRVVYPMLVILAIAAVIYYIEGRNSDNTNSSGQSFGVRDLNSALNPDGLDVEAKEGAMAPDFELETVALSAASPTTSGESWLSDYRGHPVVLNFWATWCYPCRKEIPQFVAAADRYADKGLIVIGLDQQEGASLIQPFARQYGIEYPVLIDRDGEVGQKYRLLGLPTTVFIDTNGVIQKIFRGPLEEGDSQNGTDTQGAIGESDLEAGIAAILAVPTPTPGAAGGSR
jgi:thiol-disulfide isomerase/thioredoxin